MGLFDFFTKKTKEQVQEQEESLDKGLEKTKDQLFRPARQGHGRESTVDEEVLDDLEEILIARRRGHHTTLKIIKRIEARVARDKYMSTGELDRILQRRNRRTALGEQLRQRHPRLQYARLGAPLRDHGGGRQRRGQNHHHRQAGRTASTRRARRWCSARPIPSAPPPWTSSSSGASGWACPSFRTA